MILKKIEYKNTIQPGKFRNFCREFCKNYFDCTVHFILMVSVTPQMGQKKL